MQHILVVGLGSVGSRHVSTFRALGIERIDAVRSGNSTLPQLPFVNNRYNNLQEALTENPDAAVICTPSALHAQHTIELLESNIEILVEKPLATNINDIYVIQKHMTKSLSNVSVAYNIRYHPFIQKLRSWGHTDTPLGDLISTRVHFGSYLPTWHPWEDYAQSYAARLELGGGAALTSIHEIDYCIWLWGHPLSSHRMSSRKSSLGTNVDETTFFHIEHDTKIISNISLSLSQRNPTRVIQLSFTEGDLQIDLLNNTWVEMRNNERIISCCPSTAISDSYTLQAKDFIRSKLNGKGSLGSVADAIASATVINSC